MKYLVHAIFYAFLRICQKFYEDYSGMFHLVVGQKLARGFIKNQKPFLVLTTCVFDITKSTLVACKYLSQVAFT